MATSLPIQYSDNVPGKAAEDGSNTRTCAPTWEFLAPGFRLIVCETGYIPPRFYCAMLAYPAQGRQDSAGVLSLGEEGRTYNVTGV